jgi:hypothetical protein
VGGDEAAKVSGAWACRLYRLQAVRPVFGLIYPWLGGLGARAVTQSPAPGAAFRKVPGIAVEAALKVAVGLVPRAVPGGPSSFVSRGTRSGARGEARSEARAVAGR